MVVTLAMSVTVPMHEFLKTLATHGRLACRKIEVKTSTPAAATETIVGTPDRLVTAAITTAAITTVTGLIIDNFKSTNARRQVIIDIEETKNGTTEATVRSITRVPIVTGTLEIGTTEAEVDKTRRAIQEVVDKRITFRKNVQHVQEVAIVRAVVLRLPAARALTDARAGAEVAAEAEAGAAEVVVKITTTRTTCKRKITSQRTSLQPSASQHGFTHQR